MPRAGTIPPAPKPSFTPVPRREPAVRSIAASWRTLTGGTSEPDDPRRRTLIACSGGGDSCGLAIALAAAIPSPASLLAIAHVVHDLRPEPQALADRDAAAALAAALGLDFFQARILVRREGKNAEAAARRLRYRALADLAHQTHCPFLATAHHSGDQLETILMGLLRGAGPRGLAGVAPKRRVPQTPGSPPITIIRPALSLTRADLQHLCTSAGWVWREDATNSDQSRLRAALRHTVIPDLEQLRPGAARRAAHSAALLNDAAGLISDLAQALLAHAATDSAQGSLTWDRAHLRSQRPIILGALLKAAALSLSGDRGQDRLGSKQLNPMIRAINNQTTDPRRFQWPGLNLTITTHTVTLSRTPDARPTF